MKETKELAIKLGIIKQRPMPLLFSRLSLNVVQKYKYVVVLDFESTCWENRRYQTQEIIEFPAVLLNTSNGKIESEFRYYVQPQENPTLSSFCKQLTGITQEQVDEGIPLSLCLAKFTHWLENLERKYNIMFIDANYVPDGVKAGSIVTWTDWDLNICLHYEAKRKQLKVPYQLNNWIDLKLLYKNFYQKKPNGLEGALENVGIRFEGRQHSGLDDSRNTAYLAWKMIKDGCEMKITKTLTPTSAVKTCQTTLTQQLKCKKRAIVNPGKKIVNENCERKWKGTSSPDKSKISESSSTVISLQPNERDKSKGLSIRNENIFNNPNKRRIIPSEQNVPKKLKALTTPEKLKDITENSLPSIPLAGCSVKSLSAGNEKLNTASNKSIPSKITPFTRKEQNHSKGNPIQVNQFTTKSSLSTNINPSTLTSNTTCSYKPFSVYDKKVTSSKMNSAWQVTFSGASTSNSSLVKTSHCSPGKNITNKSCTSLFQTSLKTTSKPYTSDIDRTALQKGNNNIEGYSRSVSNDQREIFHHKEENCHLNLPKPFKLTENSKSHVSLPPIPKPVPTKSGPTTKDLNGDSNFGTKNLEINKVSSDTKTAMSVDDANICSQNNQFTLVSSHNKTKDVSTILSHLDNGNVTMKSMCFAKLNSVENQTKHGTTVTTDWNYNVNCPGQSNFPNKKSSSEMADGHLKSANQTKRAAMSFSKGFDFDGNPQKRRRTINFSEMSTTPPVCNCGKRAKKRMVQNPGPNVGRFFYSCTLRSRNSTKAGCGFFQWEKKIVVSKMSNSYSTFHINSYLTRTKDTDN